MPKQPSQKCGPPSEERHDHSNNQPLQLIAENLIELRKISEHQHNNNAVLNRIAELESKIMATQAEQAAILRTLVSQITTVRAEVNGVQTAVNEAKVKIAELEAIISGGGGTEATQELIDAVAAVKEAVQFVDDEIPNLPPVPPAV